MTRRPTHLPQRPEAATYEICVRGHLDAHWAERLSAPSLGHEPNGTTMLRGIATDQAALHGLLQRIRDLGLTLVSVSRVDPIDNAARHQPTNTGISK